ncbi:PREDICTED: putative F-box/LRR-repeat protein 23 [Fragaria vesca subsp. vesca]|uniref:putative F-box/LRR-repeat protein 23 n=1 Tax=Fragaria vesca subsp. vesca TaxID=101020 RepID=UPI0002C36AF1|nr:PREDICTED: putative F-box/LRR-repeat protein 23 [Fragaria vesca subsp. vesca]
MAEPSNKTERQDGNQNPRSWIDLPEDVTASILLRLGTIEILVTALNVCTTWRRICKESRMWHTIDICDVSVYGKLPSRYPMDRMCRKAIDLTCGNLVNISVHNFGSDDLLKYITDRYSAPKLPQLEYLELSQGNYIFDNPPFNHIRHAYLEVIGRCCPRLKSLKLKEYNTDWFFDGWDGDALAIAETMHGLHHLHLLGDKITSKGLRAILDGCPLLVSLDLRHCWHIDLDPEREELQRCIDQIENLRLPHDSTHDYERLAAQKRN